MKKTFLLILVFAACLASGLPADCKTVKTTYTVEKSIDVMQSQSGWAKTPPVRLSQESVTYSSKKAAEAAMANAMKPGLPSTPMGAAIRQPGDYLYQTRPGGTRKQVREGKGLNGLPDTRMGATIGMASDSVGRQNANATSYNAIGLPSTKLGATVGKPGDAMRSDLRNNGYKHFPSRQAVTQTARPVSTQTSQPTSSYAASYGEYDGKKKRNY